MNREVAIFDLDGCISNDLWRRARLPKPCPKPDYDWYNDVGDLDLPVNQDVVVDELEAGREIRIVTARPRKYEDRTRDWLRRNFALGDAPLWMRPEGDLRPSPELKFTAVQHMIAAGVNVAVAYDDRQDVIDAYKRLPGVIAQRLYVAETPPRTAADVLQGMADTFRERNAEYKSNYRMVGPIMEILFPEGVPADLLGSDQFHLFELMIVKLSRLAISDLNHKDSALDAGVYAAMITAIIEENENA